MSISKHADNRSIMKQWKHTSVWLWDLGSWNKYKFWNSNTRWHCRPDAASKEAKSVPWYREAVMPEYEYFGSQWHYLHGQTAHGTHILYIPWHTLVSFRVNTFLSILMKPIILKVQKFSQKPSRHFKIISAKSVTSIKFRTDGPRVLFTTVHKI